jgi:hypothetical protein
MENKGLQIDFRIVRILDLGYFINETVNVNQDNIKLGYGMDFSLDVTQNWIEFIVSVEFKDEETGITFLSGSTLTRFFVKDLSNFIGENNLALFQDNSVETLFGIAFTHMRAMFSKNIAGSKFGWMIVPVIDAKKLFTDLFKNTQKSKEEQSKS